MYSRSSELGHLKAPWEISGEIFLSQNGRGFPEVHVWILEKGIQDGPRAGLSGVPAARGGLCPVMDAGDPAEQLRRAWPSAQKVWEQAPLPRARRHVMCS